MVLTSFGFGLRRVLIGRFFRIIPVCRWIIWKLLKNRPGALIDSELIGIHQNLGLRRRHIFLKPRVSEYQMLHKTVPGPAGLYRIR